MKDIISKYLSNTITDLELSKLSEWLTKPKNIKIFETYIKDDYNLNKLYKTDDIDTVLKKVWLKVQNEEVKMIPFHKRSFFKYAVAASIALLISLTFIFNKDDAQVSEPIIVNNNIKMGTDKATLTLEDGTDITLKKGQDYIADNIESNGEEIIYEASETPKQEIVYNYLTIPRGGQYFVKLADGTQVWLNSETKLKYPVNFIEGETRQVELVYGEAYFDVSPSTLHNGSKFKVFNQSQEVEVLGTQFNVKAYNDETNIYTTLVEGKVAVKTATGSEILKPSQQSNVNVLDSNISVSVVTIGDIISWKEGVFDFKAKPLKEIMTVLSRWYDMDIEFENKALEQEHFNGRINKQYSIEEILISIKDANVISNFEIYNKTVVLK